MRKIVALFILGFFTYTASAQTGYAFRVKFANKNGGLTIADSLQFLSQKSLDRRSRQGILVDNTDIPVVQAYIDSVMSRTNAVKLVNRSRWFNQIVVVTFDSAKINDALSLPFVTSAKLVAEYINYSPKTEVAAQGLSARKFPKITYDGSFKTTGDPNYYNKSWQQIHINNGDFLHDQGLKGQGMTIAVLDAGFMHTSTHTQFDSLRNEGRLLGQYTFVWDTTFVYQTSNDHGTNVTGLIIGEDPGSYIGSAPKANIYQLMTEDIRSEQPIEEDNWLSGAEYADSAGADIINGSLGYNEFYAPHASYTYANDFDGNTTLAARAANMAVSKGIFTCVAQGNSGLSAWKFMLTPADADSAYSVGSVDSFKVWSDSGFGPNADGQVKPNGMAMGKRVSLVGANGQIGQSNGSSFASPLIAGMVACLWQGLRNYTESQIRHLVMQVSDRYTNPDSTNGFGIPDFKLAYNLATGVDEFENEHKVDYKLYPNPTTGSFSLRVKQSFLPYDFELYNVSGQKVSELKGINNIVYSNHVLRTLPTGTYFVKMKSSKGEVSSTVLKQ